MATYNINNLPTITNLISLSSMAASNVAILNGVAVFQSGVTAMLTQSLPKPTAGHKYYGRCLQSKTSGSTEEDSRFEYFLRDGAQSQMTFGNFSDVPQDGDYHLASSILSLSSPADGQWVFRAFTVNATGMHGRKEFMLIDLTSAFGSGNEPSKEWCDINIPFFEHTITNPTLNINPGDIINCPYSGGEKPIILPRGQYKLECWGGMGDYTDGESNNPGGYSVGNFKQVESSALFLVCGEGGWWSGGSEKRRRYNGGGKGAVSASHSGQCSGGGATHIAMMPGALYSLSDNKESVVIVAGGSGGTCYNNWNDTYYYGGVGGGITGGDGFGFPECGGKAGTQSSGGAVGSYGGSPGVFGFGGDASDNGGGGGGGGWYGGSGSGGYNNLLDRRVVGGGGGSGYIADATHAVGTVYLTDAKTANAFDSGFVNNPDPNSAGYIRITVNDIYLSNIRIKVNSEWKQSSHSYVKKNNSWHKADSVLVKVNGVWKECY